METAGVTEKGQPVCSEGDKYLIHPDSIILGDELHQGSTCKIFKAIYNGRTVAIKQFTLPKVGQSTTNLFRQVLLNEYGNLKVVESDFVVGGVGVCCDSEKGIYWVVMEYIPYNLEKVLADKQVAQTWKDKIELSVKVCRAVHHLHRRERPMLIRRISSKSFLLKDQKDTVKICGLGFLKTKSSAARCSKFKSTVKYIPSEHLQDISLAYNEKSESYGLGIVLWEIATGRTPFEGKSDSQVCKTVMAGDMEDLPADCPLEFKNVIDGLREKNVDKRLTIDDACQRLSAITNIVN